MAQLVASSQRDMETETQSFEALSNAIATSAINAQMNKLQS